MLERDFDPVFTTRLALREKQIQQNYRPIIGIHKWFARRPGTVLRNLLLAEFNGEDPLGSSYWSSHAFRGVVADPFMGGGTSVYEANRLGFSVVGADINPMAYWIVRQSLAKVDLEALATVAARVVRRVEERVGTGYVTKCLKCDGSAPVKYWLWVKTQPCPQCGTINDLFPGYLLAEAVRHPCNVVACSRCGQLNEYDDLPSKDDPKRCTGCNGPVYVDGSARRQRVTCRSCNFTYAYPDSGSATPPEHRMWAIEYECVRCKPTNKGRFFKQPDQEDLARFNRACESFSAERGRLLIPDDDVPAGDETDRLRRWGYRRYRDMFNQRQLFGLGTLLGEISGLPDSEVRSALLTVFSDFLRYQNMLCRYDTYALKCQDIFSVHGFPVGLVQCENNLLGIPRVGSGSFRHFVEKYLRAKRYCEAPFETRQTKRTKEIVPIVGETIAAEFVDAFPADGVRRAWLSAAPATSVELPPQSLDGVFTDPPYFDNVQYAELIDFCYVWLRLALWDRVEFTNRSTRNAGELTGNATVGRGLDHFTEGLSNVFSHYAAALKQGAPFVFTFHHNDVEAYVPLVVAILDAGLMCTAVLPAAGEMAASLHIAGTRSSILDSIFVCRSGPASQDTEDVTLALEADVAAMQAAGVKVSEGDLRCLTAGRVARSAVNRLRSTWSPALSLPDRMGLASAALLAERNRLGVAPPRHRARRRKRPPSADEPIAAAV